MRLKPVFTWSSTERKVRLFRIIWKRGIVGDGKGYSAFLSLSLVPHLFWWHSLWDGFDVVVLGLRIHHKRSYGGRFV